MKESIRIRKIAVAGLLVALSVILETFKIVLIPGIVVITFKQLPVFIGGILLGPFFGAIIGFITDIINLLLVGDFAQFNPFFTLVSILVGICGGFLYRRKLTWLNMMLTNGFRSFVLYLGLQSAVIYCFYGMVLPVFITRFFTNLFGQFLIVSIILILLIPLLTTWRKRINGGDPAEKQLIIKE